MKNVIKTSLVLSSVWLSACGANQFSKQDPNKDGVTVTCADDKCVSKNVDEVASKDYSAPPNDILFVVDDSASMVTILNNVKAGFASLAGVEFPNDTLMAVTYMSPDIVDASGNISFGTSYSKVKYNVLSDTTPGHLKLVTASDISSYLSITHDSGANQFVLQGCDQEWFAPNAVNSSGERCLDGAIQVPLYGTGVEAGLVSLEQLLKKNSANGKRLFRSGSMLHVIFVSDTHEPGDSYWGKANAPQRQSTLAEIQSVINANSPGLVSIKFSGVLPVPKVGNPILNGLRVSGNVPQTDAEAYVDGENGTTTSQMWWDYSYVPFIKATGGVISHPKNNDWQNLAEDLIEDSSYTGNIVIPLAYKIKELQHLEFNGVEINLSLVTVSSDGLSLSVRQEGSQRGKLKIKIKYTTTAEK